MPTYNILGLSVFIPDLTDLTTFITSPIQSFITSSFSAGSAIINNIVAGVSAGVSAAVSAAVSAGMSALSGLTSTVNSTYAYATGALTILIEDVLEAIYGIPGQVIGAFNTAAAGLNAGISGLTSALNLQVLPSLSNLQGQVGGLGAQIAAGTSDISSRLTAGISQVQASVDMQGQALQLAFSQGLGPIADAFQGLGPAIFKALQDNIVTPAAQGVQGIATGFNNLMAAALSNLQAAILQPSASIITDPLGAITRIIGAIIGTGATIAIPALLGELIQPLKNLGLGQLAAYFWDLADFKSVGGAIFGTLTSVSVTAALRQGLNLIYRPEIPPLGQVDQMFFQGQISLERWRDFYRLEGWTEADISAWFGAMFREPSDRMLIDLMGTSGVPDDWIRDKLKKGGVPDTDLVFYLQYAKRRKIQDEINSARAALVGAFVDGFRTYDFVAEALASMDLTEYEVNYTMYAADLRRAVNRQREQVTAIKLAYENREIDDVALTSSLTEIVQDPELVKNIVAIEKFKLRPTKEAQGETTKRLTAAQVERALLDGVIDEQVYRDLIDLLPYDPDSKAILIAQALRKKKGLEPV